MNVKIYTQDKIYSDHVIMLGRKWRVVEEIPPKYFSHGYILEDEGQNPTIESFLISHWDRVWIDCENFDVFKMLVKNLFDVSWPYAEYEGRESVVMLKSRDNEVVYELGHHRLQPGENLLTITRDKKVKDVRTTKIIE